MKFWRIIKRERATLKKSLLYILIFIAKSVSYVQDLYLDKFYYTGNQANNVCFGHI